MEKESGFFLVEVLAAGLALLVMASCLLLFARSMELRVADGCRARAVFLARTQFAAAQAEAAAGGLSLGSYAWQGEAEDLQGEVAEYEVATEVQGEGEGLYKVSVQVSWQGQAARGHLELEREVVRHGQGGEE